jgi:hypothetical protein
MPAPKIRLLAPLLVLALAVGAAGCDSLLDVDKNPQAVPGDEIDRPTSLDARLIGAEADFFLALDMAIVYGGLFTDELLTAGNLQDVDERRVTPDNDLVGAADEQEEFIDGLWAPMQRAAFTSNLLQEDILAGKFPRIPQPAGSPELARMSLFAGYSKLILGELFCSTAFNGTGPEFTSEQTWQLASDELTMAIDATQAEPEVRLAALVGRARARLHLGDDAGALADAGQVPAAFAFLADVYSTNSFKEENDIHDMLTDSQRFSVDSTFRGLTIDATATPDPRVDVFQDPLDPLAIDGATPLFQARKYITPVAPIRFATGDEAQYIIAEISGGQQAVDIINAVRLRHGVSTPWSPAGTGPDEIRDKVIDEKARTHFLEGQRMGDLRRYVRKFALNLFPTGPGFGDQTCFPLPDAERENNPGF